VNVVAKFDGRVINKGVRTVAADGMTMKIEVVAIGQSGNEVRHKTRRSASQTPPPRDSYTRKLQRLPHR
jgi:hypothetical protein